MKIKRFCVFVIEMLLWRWFIVPAILSHPIFVTPNNISIQKYNKNVQMNEHTDGSKFLWDQGHTFWKKFWITERTSDFGRFQYSDGPLHPEVKEHLKQEIFSVFVVWHNTPSLTWAVAFCPYNIHLYPRVDKVLLDPRVIDFDTIL